MPNRPPPKFNSAWDIALYGDQDVFAAAEDVGYRHIADWLAGGIEEPGCVPTEEVGP